jgi:hypothetical protein
MALDFDETDQKSSPDVAVTSIDKAEMSEFIESCSVEVWKQVRDQLRSECALNRDRLKDYLELSARLKAAQISRSKSTHISVTQTVTCVFQC